MGGGGGYSSGGANDLEFKSKIISIVFMHILEVIYPQICGTFMNMKPWCFFEILDSRRFGHDH